MIRSFPLAPIASATARGAEMQLLGWHPEVIEGWYTSEWSRSRTMVALAKAAISGVERCSDPMMRALNVSLEIGHILRAALPASSR